MASKSPILGLDHLSRLSSRSDECLILVKALPHRSSSYFETVCCAGVGRDLKWRRLYPVPFRVLENSQQFKRWHWVTYKFTSPEHDGRRESQKVVPETIIVSTQLRPGERSRVASALTRESIVEAVSLGETLTLIQPSELTFSWKRKSDARLEDERAKHALLANQTSLLNKIAKPLEPCPFEFVVRWISAAGRTHTHTCDDWESSTAFFRRREALGEVAALGSLKATYEGDYLRRGIRFALGTHSRRKAQWLLVGIIRVDEYQQTELSF